MPRFAHRDNAKRAYPNSAGALSMIILLKIAVSQICNAKAVATRNDLGWRITVYGQPLNDSYLTNDYAATPERQRTAGMTV